MGAEGSETAAPAIALAAAHPFIALVDSAQEAMAALRPHARPRVLLVGGVGVGAWAWADVVAGLTPRYAVDIIERPGQGLFPPWPPGQGPSLHSEVARVLEAIAANPGGPVTLVVHSAAGFVAEALARCFPTVVDRMVLLDVSIPELIGPPLPGLLTVAHHLGPVLEAVGGARIHTTFMRAVDQAESSPAVARWRAKSLSTPHSLTSLLIEHAVFAQQAADTRALREYSYPSLDREHRPEVILFAAKPNFIPWVNRWWQRQQKAYAQSVWIDLAGEVRFAVLPRCPHMVQIHAPELVIDAIVGGHRPSGSASH